MNYPIRLCPKHNIEMFLCFTTYICDLCNPPKGIIESTKEIVQEKCGFRVGDRIKLKYDLSVYSHMGQYNGLEGIVTDAMFVSKDTCYQDKDVISIDLSPHWFGLCVERTKNLINLSRPGNG